MKTRDYHVRSGDTAACWTCGAVSHYMPLSNWCGARLFRYWNWWKGFKRAHVHG